MKPLSLAAAAAATVLSLAPCALAQGLGDDPSGYPFVGEWDCGVATFVFTPDIYFNGSDDLTILEIQEGTDGSYTLFFEDDYLITLSGFTGGEMGWYSHSSGDDLQCRRL